MKYAVLFVLFVGNAALASTSTSSVAYPTLANDKFIRQGNIELGGSLSYFNSEGSTNFNISPDLGYFVADNLNLGLALSYSTFSSDSSVTVIGPKVSYFFYETGPFASLISQKISYGNGSYIGEVWLGMTSVGGKFFLNSSIALGLDLNYQYGLSEANRSSTVTTVTGGFSTYF